MVTHGKHRVRRDQTQRKATSVRRIALAEHKSSARTFKSRKIHELASLRNRTSKVNHTSALNSCGTSPLSVFALRPSFWFGSFGLQISHKRPAVAGPV